MRLTTLKDLLVVATMLAGVAFAGTSVVQAVGAPLQNEATTAATACTDSPSVVSLAADAPDAPAPAELQC